MSKNPVFPTPSSPRKPADGESDYFVISLRSFFFFFFVITTQFILHNRQEWSPPNAERHQEHSSGKLFYVKETTERQSVFWSPQQSEAPSSTSLPTRDVKTSLNLPLRTIEDVLRTERELSNTAKRHKYVSQHSISRKG